MSMHLSLSKFLLRNLCRNCILDSAPALCSRDANIKVTCVEIVTLCGEWRRVLIKFSLSRNDKQMWWFTGLISLWHLCGFW